MKFIKDIILNILSQSLFVGVQQIILFPIFEQKLGPDNFGWFLFIYGIFNVFVITIATSFTNLYQKNFHTYKNELKEKNVFFIFYKMLLIYFVFIVGSFTLFIFFTKVNIIEYFFLSILIILTASRMFLLVIYRVKKEFGKILVINVILSTMYVSLILFDINAIIEILIGFVIVELAINIVIYLSARINILQFINAKLTKFEFSSLHFLLLSGFSGSLMNYSDRFVINFLLGSSSISVFYIATLPTKLMLFPFTMISSVILSYLADTEKITRKIKYKVLQSLPLVFIVIFCFSYFLGLFLIELLYTDYLKYVKEIYLIVTITFGFMCMDFIIRSFLLKYYSLKNKSIIDILTLILFVCLALLFNYLDKDIRSIAYAQFVTFLLKFILELVIFLKLKTLK